MVIAPRAGVVAPDQPAQIVVQPLTNGLAAGTYHGSVTLQFDDGAVRVIGLTTVVSAAGATATTSAGARVSGAPCQATQLLPSIISLGSGFAVPAGWPVAIQTQVQDDCGVPLDTGSVAADH